MAEDPSSPMKDALERWLTLERQGPIVGGVVVLLGLWLGKVIEPFALGIPAYAVYFALSEPAKQLGLLGIEGSGTLFWISAVIWLYALCAVLLYVAIALGEVRESAT